MSSPFFTLELKGTEGLTAKFRDLTDLDTQDILDQSAAVILDHIRFRFLHTQTDAQGNAWPESQAAKDRRKSGRDGTTLFDTGKLFRSIQEYSIDENTRAIGANAENAQGVQYGKFAQYGTIHMPKREFLGFGDTELQIIANFVHQKIEGILRS